MPRILPLLLLCASASAADVAQFRAEDFGTPWRAALSTDALVPVHAATNGGTSHILQASLAPGDTLSVACTVQEPYENLFLQAFCRIDGILCQPGITNLVGAAWTSTHNPSDPTDHEPGIATRDIVFGRNCPVAHDATIRVGWTHDTDRLWVRNLVLVPDGTSWGETDHCIAIDWEPGLEVDLDQYLSSESLLVKDVIPYIQALQLDGNPACPDNLLSFLPEEVPATLSFPSLRQGIELGHYLDCRPSLPTGTTTVP